jgi:hypothetical protein
VFSRSGLGLVSFFSSTPPDLLLQIERQLQSRSVLLRKRVALAVRNEAFVRFGKLGIFSPEQCFQGKLNRSAQLFAYEKFLANTENREDDCQVITVFVQAKDIFCMPRATLRCRLPQHLFLSQTAVRARPCNRRMAHRRESYQSQVVPSRPTTD